MASNIAIEKRLEFGIYELQDFLNKQAVLLDNARVELITKSREIATQKETIEALSSTVESLKVEMQAFEAVDE